MLSVGEGLTLLRKRHRHELPPDGPSRH
jgi:hypothetical protein